MPELSSHIVMMVPTYNESENVVAMLDALEAVAAQDPARRYSRLVVDDSSPDGTGEAVEAYAAEHDAVFLHRRERAGLGRAMVAGFERSLAELDPDIIVTIDCDFQWDPLDIPLLLRELDAGADVAVASRHAPGGGLDGWPVGRRFTHWVANTLFATWVAGSDKVLDHNGNLRALRVKGCLDQIDLKSIPVRGYAFFNWMIFEFERAGARFAEVPVTFHWRQQGHSKVSFNPRYASTFFRDTFEYIRSCLWIREARRKSQS